MKLFKLNAFLANLLILIVSVSPKVPNFIELAKGSGYESEEHKVFTEDGYILSMFRITKGVECKEKMKKTPVFFMPPLLAAADTALEAGVNASLPYLISDECFDTWVGNPRGTYYGRRHVHLNPDKNKEFWDFTVEEIGTYDAPALIDHILDSTKVDKLIFIGFSQGGGTFFVMCSERPEYCDKIKLMIGLAPATRNLKTKSRFIKHLFNNIEKNIAVYDNLRIWEVMGRDQVTSSLRIICRDFTLICEWIVAYADSPHPGSVAEATYKKILEHFPAGTSVKNMVKYSQSGRSDKFVKFDYGKEMNYLKYGRPTPLEFNLTCANVPVLLMTGQNDGIVDVEDVKWLAGELPNVIEMSIVEDPLWNHVDMFYSQLTGKVLFPKILQYLLRYSET